MHASNLEFQKLGLHHLAQPSWMHADAMMHLFLGALILDNRLMYLSEDMNIISPSMIILPITYC